LAKARPSPSGISAATGRGSSSRRSSGELARRPALVVEALGLDQLLDQADLVVGVEDGEVRTSGRPARRGAQDLDADRVEGAEPRHALDGAADRAPMRCFISRAALLVKVTARIWLG
jgi:hypothetical protein